MKEKSMDDEKRLQLIKEMCPDKEELLLRSSSLKNPYEELQRFKESIREKKEKE